MKSKTTVYEMKEGSIPAIVLGEQYRSSESGAELVLPVDGPARSNEAARIEFIIAQILPKRSMKIIGSGRRRLKATKTSIGSSTFS